MEGLSIRIVFDRKGDTKKDPQKKGLVQIEVWDKVTRKKVYLSTGIKILSSQYSTNAGFSIKSHPNAAILKATVYKMYHRIEAFIHSDKCLSIEDVKNWDKAATEHLTTDVFIFIEEDLKKRNPSDAVWEYNRSFLARLKEYGKIKTFKDLTYSNIENFDYFLKKYIKSQPTLYKRHSLFKGYIEKARKRGLIDRNPYDEFHFKKGKSEDPVYLVEQEVEQIIKYRPTGPTKESLARVKDLFLFQCYTGLAFSDVKQLTSDHISIDINGKKWIRKARQKTKNMCNIPLMEEPLRIIEKYKEHPDCVLKGTLLPVLSNQKMNAYIKEIGIICGFNKSLSTHMGRHTCATTIALSNGMPMESLAKLLGHKNIRTTQLYARITDMKLNADMELLEEKLTGIRF